MARSHKGLRDRVSNLRTTNRTRVAQLRAGLREPDQLLLTLRIHHRMDYREIAQVMLGEGEQDEARIAREAARLRKRLQLVKELLRKQLHVSSAAAPASTGD